MVNLKMRTRGAIAAGLLGMTVLAGCGRSADDDQRPEIENVDGDDRLEDAPAEPIAPAPSPSMPTAATNDSAIVEPQVVEAPVAPDQQMLDDADATGMTARVQRDEAASNEASAP